MLRDKIMEYRHYALKSAKLIALGIISLRCSASHTSCSTLQLRLHALASRAGCMEVPETGRGRGKDLEQVHQRSQSIGWAVLACRSRTRWAQSAVPVCSCRGKACLFVCGARGWRRILAGISR